MYGHRPPETARTVAKAFYEGRKCKRGNCHTDGETYWLFNNAIARRIKDEDIPAFTARKMMGQEVPRRLEFSWHHWPTKTTARHLAALGCKAECIGSKNPSPRFNGIEVSMGRWYTPDEIAALRPPPPAPPRIPRQPKFVNLTPSLFA